MFITYCTEKVGVTIKRDFIYRGHLEISNDTNEITHF